MTGCKFPILNAISIRFGVYSTTSGSKLKQKQKKGKEIQARVGKVKLLAPQSQSLSLSLKLVQASSFFLEGRVGSSTRISNLSESPFNSPLNPEPAFKSPQIYSSPLEEVDCLLSAP